MPVAVASIQKTGSNGLVDIYTITYTDGTTSTFEITNGKDGKDGQDGEDGKNANGEPISIVSIQKTGTNGLVDIYTITYSNNTKSTFTVTNGKDGEDGEDITAMDLYESYCTVYGDSLTYAEFLSLYLQLGGESGHTAINDCLQSAAKIYSQFIEWNTETATKDDVKDAMYTGACVIYRIDQDYTYFLTNYHVVYSKNGAEKTISDTIHCYLYGSAGGPSKQTQSGTTVYDYGENAISCEYIGGAVEYDLAIVRAKTSDVKAVNENVKAVTLAKEYYVGEKAIAIGNPNGEGISVTQGIVCVDSENISLSIDGTSRYYRSVRIDTALYHGNSGGGLFNGKGELIGLANAGDGTDQNVNYAIPVSIVKGIASNILLHHADGDATTNGVYKIKLGITVTGENSKYTYDEKLGYGRITEDVLINEVTAGGIASIMGLQAGDIVTGITFGGKTYAVDRTFHIGDILPYLTKGVAFSIVYQRNGEQTMPTYTVKASDLLNVK